MPVAIKLGPLFILVGRIGRSVQVVMLVIVGLFCIPSLLKEW